MKVPYSKATHAVIGIGPTPEHGRGVLSWHDHELDAWRESRQLNILGGKTCVVPAPAGELGAAYQKVQAFIGF